MPLYMKMSQNINKTTRHLKFRYISILTNLQSLTNVSSFYLLYIYIYIYIYTYTYIKYIKCMYTLYICRYRYLYNGLITRL